jgi:hypothetical protein
VISTRRKIIWKWYARCLNGFSTEYVLSTSSLIITALDSTVEFASSKFRAFSFASIIIALAIFTQ